MTVNSKTSRKPSSKPWLGRHQNIDGLTGLLFVLPVLIYFVVFLLYPTVAALYYSFTHWDMRTEPVWVGLQNYQELLSDRTKYPYFWHSMMVTAKYTLIAVPLGLITALGLALLVDAAPRGKRFFQAAFYLPVITAEAAVATVWRWLYDPLYGLFNAGLEKVGLPGQNWLGQPDLVLPALAIISAWQSGSAMLIFMSGLKSIPRETYEAAAIDGADGWKSFLHVTLPMLRPTTFYLSVTGLIGAFQVFGVVYVLFGAAGGGLGGPQQSGLTYVLSLYNHAFRYNDMGAASAMSFLLFVVIFIITFLQFRFLPQRQS
ncbi:carbohydrate ABC transporter permease [Deinococcus misasensis]|uniref:carbohydrate ABC transporter permease n=1 Tax=Deinococcus misasensis TaxID=392413 RepID=UPI00054CECE8|nr:sugar ABC transporter permease [Deinococcus misasensis]